MEEPLGKEQDSFDSCISEKEEEPEPEPAIPNEKVGDVDHYDFHDSVTKEILKVGTGYERPMLHSQVTCTYKAYFNKHSEFIKEEASPVVLTVGDPCYIEGLKTGLQNMRKGEKAKFTIKSREAFKKDDSALIIPEAYKDKRDILAKKKVVYEVEIIDFNERYDLNNDGNYMKIILKKGKGKNKPENIDEVCVDIRVEQDSKIKLEHKHCFISVDSDCISNTVRRIIASSRVEEESKTDIPYKYLEEKDPEMVQNVKLDQGKPISVYVRLYKFIRTRDVYGDSTTYSRTLKCGKKDSHPYFESTTEFKLKVYYNEEIIFSNLYLKGLIDPEKYEFLQLDKEDDKLIGTDKLTLTYKLDEFKLPPLIKKMIRECSTDEVVEYDTTNASKLQSVFGFPDIDFSKYPTSQEKQTFRIFATVIQTNRPSVLRELVIAQKKERILYLKGLAGEMYKLGKLRKACKLYQKINGYYNFGDINNLAAGEKEEDVKPIRDELIKIKLQCFLNTIVCKYKLLEYGNIRGIAEQVLEMDKDNAKAYYFTIKALVALKNFEEAKDWALRGIKVGKDNADLVSAYNEAITEYKNYTDGEHKKYSKLFG